MTAFLSRPGSGPAYNALGIPIEVRASGDGTADELDAVEVDFPPGVPFPPHRHQHSHEAFYVIEGEVTATLGDETTVLGTGGFAFASKGTVHGFSNDGTEPARVLAWQWPSPDIVGFLDALKELPAGEEPDMEQVMAIMQRFDFEPVG